MNEKNNPDKSESNEIQRMVGTRRIDLSRDQRSLDVVPKTSQQEPKENPFKNVLKSSESNVKSSGSGADSDKSD